MSADLDELERRLGHRFRDRSLLERALVHSSFAFDRGDDASNERLEFLGDSVVGLATAHLLFEAHPTWREGELTRALHNLVDGRALSKLARELELGRHIQLGATEERSDGRNKDRILEDAMEAVLGAIYIDAGLEPVRAFARRVYADALAADSAPVERDPKSRLQELVMERFGEFPSYECIADSGVDGAEDRFTMRLIVLGAGLEEGVGRSKRLAERLAAESALASRSFEALAGREDGRPA